jgi:CRISPR/Cas system-associated protein Cas7 (RAMP superfamily)
MTTKEEVEKAKERVSSIFDVFIFDRCCGQEEVDEYREISEGIQNLLDQVPTL